MKLLSVLAATAMLFVSNSYATHHEKGKSAEQVAHDKEHNHVKDAKDHEHTEDHHKPHDHKAHHPEHKDEVKADSKKK